MNRGKAIEIAKNYAIKCGWSWREPVLAEFNNKSDYWEIRSNTAVRGGNVLVQVSNDDGAILTAKFLPR